jgi:hypothetical protein
MVCSLAEKTSKYRFTVIGLPLSEKNPAKTDVQLLVYPAKGQTNNCKSVFASFFR